MCPFFSDDMPDAHAIVWAARDGHLVATMARERILAFSADQNSVNQVHGWEP